MTMNIAVEIEITEVMSGYDRQTFWSQSRAGIIPGRTAVLTTQKAEIGGCDVYHAIHSLRSTDGGRTWSAPAPQDTLGRRALPDGGWVCPCDGTPAWHAPSGTLLATGHTARYGPDNRLAPEPRRRAPWYSVYDEGADAWAAWRTLALPEDPAWWNWGAGCTQRVDLEDGTLLLPIYGKGRDNTDRCHSARVLRCAFDGHDLTVLEIGPPLTHDVPRGFCEPSLTRFGGRFYLTLRNDEAGYVATSDDGLQFGAPQPWCFDDGQALGNYNTQQHWVTHSDALFLVYTRRGADNDFVMRNRAPLFLAQVDPEQLCIRRETEQIVAPNRGARLGNFGTTTVSPQESWIVVSEFMQRPDQDGMPGWQLSERYGGNNTTFLTRLRWGRPNSLAPAVAPPKETPTP